MKKNCCCLIKGAGKYQALFCHSSTRDGHAHDIAAETNLHVVQDAEGLILAFLCGAGGGGGRVVVVRRIGIARNEFPNDLALLARIQVDAVRAEFLELDPHITGRQ